jgi:hypothetical protein
MTLPRDIPDNYWYLRARPETYTVLEHTLLGRKGTIPPHPAIADLDVEQETVLQGTQSGRVDLELQCTEASPPEILPQVQFTRQWKLWVLLNFRHKFYIEGPTVEGEETLLPEYNRIVRIMYSNPCQQLIRQFVLDQYPKIKRNVYLLPTESE